MQTCRLWPQFHGGSQVLAPTKNSRFLQFIHNNQRVRLCRVGTHNSTHQCKLPLTFLLAQLQEALYEYLPIIEHQIWDQLTYTAPEVEFF